MTFYFIGLLVSLGCGLWFIVKPPENKKWIFDERNLDAKMFLKNVIEVPAKENSLVITLTNGFHCRTPFRSRSDRSTLFFTYPNFNLLSLFFPNN